jgi:archaemetzincin
VPFLVPGPDDRRNAIGSLADLPPDLARAFTPDGSFEAVPAPARLDWLSIARERGQSFERFRQSISNLPGDDRQLYLQPIGEWTDEDAALVARVQEFGAAFFMRRVVVRPALGVDPALRTRRNRFTGVLQLNSRDILARLGGAVPPDACGVLAVTAHDLYPHDTWSFVFGEAIVDDRVGVFSVARYDPRFYDKPADPVLRLCRVCKVFAHEACHMLGMRHCVFFNCLMNGSNHLAESDRRPLHLCPIDLRKLHWSLRFDVVERYERLLAFWRSAGVSGEAEWIERRLEVIRKR